MRWFLLYFILSIPTHLASQVSYYKDIAPIIKKHCQNCHQDGDIGPMALTNYDQVSSYASMIRFVIDTKLMPPFKANYDNVSYANERSISNDERKLIAQWIEGGLVKGISTNPAETETQAYTTNYDHTVCMSESFAHYGIYYDQYQVFPMPTNLMEDKYIDNVYFEPGNKEIVRSANISIAPLGFSTKMDQWDPRYGFFAYGSLGFTSSFPNWFSWMPHTKNIQLKKDEQLFLPAESELLLHIHYGPFGTIEKDSSCIHLTFSDNEGPTLQNVPLIHTALLADSFLIDSGIQKRVSSTFQLPIDVRLRSVTPLAHLLCRSWEVFAVLPDRSSISILSIDDWDFHWREKYVFQDALTLPKGTKIYTTANFDNTSDNPYNPSDPPHTMIAGPHMFDENFACYFEFDQSESSDGYIVKPFVSTEMSINEISFHISNADTFTLILHDLESLDKKELTAKKYPLGMHALRTAELPSKPGRYCISLESSNGVVDSWWFVIF